MSQAPAGQWRGRTAANLGGFEMMRLQARRHLESLGVDQATLAAVELVIEECVTNTLRYGYRAGGLRWIDVELTPLPEGVDVVIEDDAEPFDPLSVPEPELPTSLEAARVGGLGLLMVKRSTSRLAYSRRDGRNRLSAHVARRAAADVSERAGK